MPPNSPSALGVSWLPSDRGAGITLSRNFRFATETIWRTLLAHYDTLKRLTSSCDPFHRPVRSAVRSTSRAPTRSPSRRPVMSRAACRSSRAAAPAKIPSLPRSAPSCSGSRASRAAGPGETFALEQAHRAPRGRPTGHVTIAAAQIIHQRRSLALHGAVRHHRGPDAIGFQSTPEAVAAVRRDARRDQPRGLPCPARSHRCRPGASCLDSVGAAGCSAFAGCSFGDALVGSGRALAGPSPAHTG